MFGSRSGHFPLLFLADRKLLPFLFHPWGNRRREKSDGLSFRCELVVLGCHVQTWCSSRVNYKFQNVVYRRAAALTVPLFPGVRGTGAVGGGQDQARWGSRGQTQPGVGGQGCGDGGGPGQRCLAWRGSWSGRAGETSYSPCGAGSDGCGGWNGTMGRVGEPQGRQGIKAPECIQAPTFANWQLNFCQCYQKCNITGSINAGKTRAISCPSACKPCTTKA